MISSLHSLNKETTLCHVQQLVLYRQSVRGLKSLAAPERRQHAGTIFLDRPARPSESRSIARPESTTAGAGELPIGPIILRFTIRLTEPAIIIPHLILIPIPARRSRKILPSQRLGWGLLLWYLLHSGYNSGEPGFHIYSKNLKNRLFGLAKASGFDEHK
jgi:hypothetical protein